VVRAATTCPVQGSSVSLTSAATSSEPRGCTVTSRSANACFIAYQSGLRRPSPSTAAQDVTGQQSLSCHTIAPAVRGHHDR